MSRVGSDPSFADVHARYTDVFIGFDLAREGWVILLKHIVMGIDYCNY